MYLHEFVQVFYHIYFSYCLMFWFNNERSGRHKLINKIDNLICTLEKRLNMNCHNTVLGNVCDVYKLQCLSFMYDMCHNNISIPYFPLVLNNMIHNHNTRQSSNLHLNTVSSLDCHNFVYHCTVFWNACPVDIRLLKCKSLFLKNCKVFLSQI